MKFKFHISIIGGAGHVGFPLGLIFASKNLKVSLIDKNRANLNLIEKGICPFKEELGLEYLKKYKKNISTSLNVNDIKYSKFIVICIGTPVGKNLNPLKNGLFKIFRKIKKVIKSDQHIIVRSSIHVNAMKEIKDKFKFKNLTYCPERIVQGKSLVELPKLPQLVSGFNRKSVEKSKNLFLKICKKVVVTSVQESELIKLFSNSFRFVHFAISNQFYMMCEELGLNYEKIRKIMKYGYDRNNFIPSAGFASGPCLSKDTMQLSSFFNHKFLLGKVAMDINHGLPGFIIKNLKKKINIKNKTIGILGLSFKAETDDIRDSLSIELIKILKKNKIKYLSNDPYYKFKANTPIKDLIKKSNIIILAIPHKTYMKIKIPKNKIFINIWQ